MPTMNRLLVTGLALGKSIGVCDVCNFDYQWIFRQPSLFVWADKIVLTPDIWKVVQGKQYPNVTKLAECVKLIFETAASHEMIEILDPGEVINESVNKSIFDQILKDVKTFQRFFPEHVRLERMGDGEDSPSKLILDNEEEYCPPRIWSIYASLILARQWNATCLFNSGLLNLCRYKFGISNLPRQETTVSIDTFKTVFKPLLPNEPLLPGYALESEERCKTCKTITMCKNDYLRVLEKNMQFLMEWRNYDEVQEIKNIISSIIKIRDIGETPIDPEDIVRRFRTQETSVRKKIQRIFPKVTRWANVATMLSIPVAVAGLAADSALLTLTGSGVAGAAQVLKEGIGYMKSKYQWVSFLSTQSADKESKC